MHPAETLQESRRAGTAGAGFAGGLLTLTAGLRVAPGWGTLRVEAGQPLAAHQLIALLAPVHDHRAQGDSRASVHIVVSVAWHGQSCALRCGRRVEIKGGWWQSSPLRDAFEMAAHPLCHPWRSPKALGFFCITLKQGHRSLMAVWEVSLPVANAVL